MRANKLRKHVALPERLGEFSTFIQAAVKAVPEVVTRVTSKAADVSLRANEVNPVTEPPAMVGAVFITKVVPVPVCEAIEVALPTLVIGPVRLAFVTTVVANEPVPLPVTPPVNVIV